jgi:hypothetical protein
MRRITSVCVLAFIVAGSIALADDGENVGNTFSNQDTAATDSSSWVDSLLTSCWQTKRDLYYNGLWQQMNPVAGDNRDSALHELVCDFSGVLKISSKYPPECKIVDSLVSRYFRSSYYLLAMKFWPDVPTFYQWVQVTPDRQAVVDLFRPMEDFPSWPYDLGIDSKLAWLGPDFALYGSSLEDTIAAAIDLVTLLTPRRPVVFIRDLAEVAQISEALGGDWLWQAAQDNDSLLSLVSRVRMIFPRDIALLWHEHELPAVNDLDTIEEARIVHAPEVISRRGSEVTIELFTWSPSGGFLLCWQVYFGEAGNIRADMYALKRHLGFTFGWRWLSSSPCNTEKK